MGTTPQYGIPYPQLSDAPNGPTQMQALATQVEASLSPVDAKATSLDVANRKAGGEWRASAGVTLVTGSNKLAFPTNVVASSNITFNGTDTWTINESGVYVMHLQLRTTAANQDGALAVSGTSYSDGTLLFPGTALRSLWGDFGHSPCGYIAAGTQICAYFYNNAANTTTNFATRPPMFKIWRVAPGA